MDGWLIAILCYYITSSVICMYSMCLHGPYCLPYNIFVRIMEWWARIKPLLVRFIMCSRSGNGESNGESNGGARSRCYQCAITSYSRVKDSVSWCMLKVSSCIAMIKRRWGATETSYHHEGSAEEIINLL